MIKHLHERALKRGVDGKPFTTPVDIITARDMPPPILSRTIDEGWVATIKQDFDEFRLRGGWLVVVATEYYATTGKTINNVQELQAAIDHVPERFTLYPIAGRYVHGYVRNDEGVYRCIVGYSNIATQELAFAW
jgi:hypothetical protein